MRYNDFNSRILSLQRESAMKDGMERTVKVSIIIRVGGIRKKVYTGRFRSPSKARTLIPKDLLQGLHGHLVCADYWYRMHTEKLTIFANILSQNSVLTKWEQTRANGGCRTVTHVLWLTWSWTASRHVFAVRNNNNNNNNNNQPYLVRVTLNSKADKPVALISGSS